MLTAIVQHLILNLLQPYLKFKVYLIDLSQSDIQIIYGLQIDNGIWQRVNSSGTGIFRNKFVIYGQYIRSLHPLSFKFMKNGGAVL